MDAIKGLDDGAYADFGYRVETNPGILDLMRPAEATGLAIWIGLLILVLVMLAVRRWFSAMLVVIIAIACALGLVHGTQLLVPRVGPNHVAGSFPASSVFLCMLGFILLGVVIWGWLVNCGLHYVYLFVATTTLVWVALAQLLLNLHYVTDVIGSIAGASLIGWIAGKWISKVGHAAGPDEINP